MQFWPRVRARRSFARVRTWQKAKDAVLLGFAGYKAGMSQAIITDNRPTSLTKGEDIVVPVTIIECPPLRVVGLRCYKKDVYGSRPAAEVWAAKQDKYVSRTITVPKKDTSSTLDSLRPSDFSSVRLVVHTQPSRTGVGKKRPEVFEIGIGGSVEDQLSLAKKRFGAEIMIADVFKEGDFVDTHVITKGKGTQGPVKRFGVAIRQAKSEKTKRGPGSLGGWRAQGHTMYRVAHAGKMGFHQRCEHNTQLLKIDDDTAKVNAKGGFVRYGDVKGTYVLFRGSIGGPKKRLVQFTKPRRPDLKATTTAPSIVSICTSSQQRR